MIRDILKTFSKQRTALTSAFDALDEIRAAICAKTTEIETLRSAPRPVDEALQLLDFWIDAASTAAIDRLPLRRLLDSRNTAPDLHPEILRAPGEVTPNCRPDTEMLTALLFLAGREKLREVIEGQLSDLTRGRETLTDPERAERIAQAQADLHGLEMAEEAIIRQTERAGLTVSRRADAAALILLAADASLPS